MNIKILHGLESAKEARGIVVVIDVFRAFSIEAYIINQNAKKIIPVGNKDVAYNIKKEHNDYILVGERGGEKLPGFDYGNSPSQIEGVDFTEKTIIHTTSAGTQGLIKSINAREIITGSLVNAKAIVDYIRKNNYEDVSLLCTYYNPTKTYVDEDTICAEYIKAMLENKKYNIENIIKKMKYECGAKFFDKARNDVFPTEDFALCTNINIFNFVLKYKKIDEEYGEIIRINI